MAKTVERALAELRLARRVEELPGVAVHQHHGFQQRQQRRADAQRHLGLGEAAGVRPFRHHVQRLVQQHGLHDERGRQIQCRTAARCPAGFPAARACPAAGPCHPPRQWTLRAPAVSSGSITAGYAALAAKPTLGSVRAAMAAERKACIESRWPPITCFPRSWYSTLHSISGRRCPGAPRYSGSNCSAISASVMCLRVAPSRISGHFPPARCGDLDHRHPVGRVEVVGCARQARLHPAARLIRSRWPASGQIRTGPAGALATAECSSQVMSNGQSAPAARPIGVILSSVSSAKKRLTIIACCSLPLRTYAWYSMSFASSSSTPAS